jgi:mitochondrial fission protein ELM1
LSAQSAPVWVLLGHRTGDNNQLLRLAGELGLRFRSIRLGYNLRHLLSPRLIGASFASLDASSREELAPPWPRLVLGIGNRSVPAALAIREKSGGAAKLVRLGNPRVAPANFDLVITTPQYAIPDGPNVLRLPIGISTAPHLEPLQEELDWLGRLPRPHRLLLIGGDTFMWALRPQGIAEAAVALRDRKQGSVIAVSSARSTRSVLNAVRSALAGSSHGLVFRRFPRYPVLLDDADEIFVTADSVAMASDAIATGMPVGLIEPRMTGAGRFFYALERLGLTVPVRDVRRFWTSIQAQGLAGTIEKPVRGDLAADPLARAVTAIRTILAT